MRIELRLYCDLCGTELDFRESAWENRLIVEPCPNCKKIDNNVNDGIAFTK